MSNELKATSLRGKQPSFSKDANEVYFATVKDGVLACVFVSGKGGGALFAELSDWRNCESSFKDLVEKVRKTFGGGSAISVKLVGSAQGRKLAHEWITRAGCVLANEVDATRFDAFFYVSSGRIRVKESDAEALAPSAPVPISNRSESRPEPTGPVRVLIVDDSKTIRNLLRQTLSADPGIEVVGEAERPSQALELIEKTKPTVITLDINLPEMDGVTLLEKYLPKHPIPTVMVTALSLQEGNQVLRALNLGAVDYIQKPALEELRAMAPVIIEKIKVASHVKLKSQKPLQSIAPARPRAADGPLDFSTLLAVGASTGGVQALEVFFRGLPEKIPPVVVVQHIPPVFSAAFAKRLNDICPFEVKEAQDGDLVQPGRVLIAPGGMQMDVMRRGQQLAVRVVDAPPVNRHKPSVDFLFDSVAKEIGKDAIGVILTGMGADGAKGMLRMRQAGARTVAQDKDSCVVFGMPREAIEIGAAEQIKPLQEIAGTVLTLLSKVRAA